jgi:hypothetical protein
MNSLIIILTIAFKPYLKGCISPIIKTRVTSILFLITIAFIIVMYIQSIGSVISEYSGLFQVNVLSSIPLTLSSVIEEEDVLPNHGILEEKAKEIKPLTLDLETRKLQDGSLQVISSCL